MLKVLTELVMIIEIFFVTFGSDAYSDETLARDILQLAIDEPKSFNSGSKKDIISQVKNTSGKSDDNTKKVYNIFWLSILRFIKYGCIFSR